MGEARRQIKLGAFLHETGHHVTAWRLAEAQGDGGANFAHYVGLARIAERGCFDMLFLANTVGLWDGQEGSVIPRAGARFEGSWVPDVGSAGLPPVGCRDGLRVVSIDGGDGAG